jgi:hypothetical protein
VAQKKKKEKEKKKINFPTQPKPVTLILLFRRRGLPSSTRSTGPASPDTSRCRRAENRSRANEGTSTGVAERGRAAPSRGHNACSSTTAPFPAQAE